MHAWHRFKETKECGYLWELGTHFYPDRDILLYLNAASDVILLAGDHYHMETRLNDSDVLLYGCRPKSVRAGLGTLALCVTTALH